MAKNKNVNRADPKVLYVQKLRSLVGTVLHAQNMADQAMALARRAMTASEAEDSDALHVMENLSCACEEALEVLFNEIRTDKDEKGND